MLSDYAAFDVQKLENLSGYYSKRHNSFQLSVLVEAIYESVCKSKAQFLMSLTIVYQSRLMQGIHILSRRNGSAAQQGFELL